MRLPGASATRRTLTVVLASTVLCAAPAASSPDPGRALFTGQSHMQNGGPPCAACHAISGLRFPNGGMVGPDLSGIYQTLGPQGVDVMLQTLFFPTMKPIYDQRPLTASEQQALKAFLAQAGTTPVAERDTLVLGVLALAGFVVLVLVTWLAWRGRLRGVRAPLVWARTAAPFDARQLRDPRHLPGARDAATGERSMRGDGSAGGTQP